MGKESCCEDQKSRTYPKAASPGQNMQLEITMHPFRHLHMQWEFHVVYVDHHSHYHAPSQSYFVAHRYRRGRFDPDVGNAKGTMTEKSSYNSACSN